MESTQETPSGFTSADRTEIKRLVAEALEDDQHRRRAQRIQVEIERDKADPIVTKLYLVTLTGHQLAFPDENGRAILSQCVYARIARRESDATFFGSVVEVVAFGDGRRLKEPHRLTLTGGGVIGMVEVKEELLKD